LRAVTSSFLRYLTRRRSLTVLQILGIACGVAAVLGMVLSSQSALASFGRAVEFLRGNSTHSIQRPAGPMEEDLLVKLMEDPAVQSFSPVIERRLRLENGEVVRLLGIDVFIDRPVRPNLTTNRSTSFFVDEKSIVLEADLSARLGVSAGGKLKTTGGILSVVGTFSNPSGEPLVLMDIGNAQMLFGLAGKIDHVDLILTDEEGFRARWERGFRIQSKRQRMETLGAMLGAFRLNLEALSLFALFVGVFLIYNTAMFAVVSRRKDAGILRGLGAWRREIVAAFLVEVLVIGFVGGVLGGCLAYLLSRFLTAIIGDTISNLYVLLRPTPPSWSWWVPAVGGLLGCCAAVLGSITPLLELVRVNPAEAIRGRAPSRLSGRRARKAALFGLTLVVLSAALLAFVSLHVYVGFAGVFGIVFGLSLTTGFFIVLASRPLKRFLSLLSGIPGRIAVGNIRQNLGRTAVAVAAFMVALSMSIGLGSMIGSFRESLRWWMGTQLRGDLYVSTVAEVEVPEEFYEELKMLRGIGGVDPYRNVQIVYRGKPVHVVSIDASVLKKYTRFAWLQGDNDHWDAVKQGSVIVSESFARNFAINPGTSLVLEGARGQASLAVEAVFYDYTTEHGLIMMDRSTYLGVFGDKTISSLAIFTDAGHPDRGAVLKEVRRRAGERGLPVVTGAELHEKILGVFDGTFAVTRSMRVLAIIVAFFGIAGALMAIFIERQREFGIYRALGFSTSQVVAITFLEALGMGVASFALSIFTGSILTVILLKVINLHSFNWTVFYHFQWQPYMVALSTSVVASMLAALYPVWRVLRTYPQMQIREE
jgi:putative ABC transport system permease protein